MRHPHRRICQWLQAQDTPHWLGPLTVAVPQAHGVEFYPSALEVGGRNEWDVKLAVAEMHLQGASTRKVAAITEQHCGLEVTSTRVSRAAAALDDELQMWRDRPQGLDPRRPLRGRIPLEAADPRRVSGRSPDSSRPSMAPLRVRL
ncbi:transposase [Singulisphaera sp. GP187]|uniref:transposase n=1 Tax=Singulisphaera sp. GP187 TaxID=1882752 RepID=UPI0009413247|nr:transposase [Singulisphaera sp. GP187]